jgi:septal ring factor EnvC (AmiA/AmiB activator)
MTARRVREWPRLVAACVGLAVVLILIGVVVASASSGEGSSNSQLASLRDLDARQATELRADAQQLDGVRGQLAAAGQRLDATRAELARARSRANCLALHRGPRRVSICAAQTP